MRAQGVIYGLAAIALQVRIFRQSLAVASLPPDAHNFAVRAGGRRVVARFKTVFLSCISVCAGSSCSCGVNLRRAVFS
jgi:hypothetical protein